MMPNATQGCEDRLNSDDRRQCLAVRFLDALERGTGDLFAWSLSIHTLAEVVDRFPRGDEKSLFPEPRSDRREQADDDAGHRRMDAGAEDAQPDDRAGQQVERRRVGSPSRWNTRIATDTRCRDGQAGRDRPLE